MVFLCDFHREKSWKRWFAKGSNDVSHCKDQLLARMRKIARAEDMSKMGVDPCKRAWTRASGRGQAASSIHTSNGRERQNEVFKYHVLAQHRDKTFSEMLSVLIESFSSKKHARYSVINISKPRLNLET